MLKRFTSLILLALPILVAPAAMAEPIFPSIGTSRLYINDFLGDGHDRFRSGAYNVSFFRPLSYQDGEHFGPNTTLEYRLRAEIFGPWKPQSNTGIDRPYGALIGFGMLYNYRNPRFHLRAGVEWVHIGASDGLLGLHNLVHEVVNFREAHRGEDSINNRDLFAANMELSSPYNILDNFRVKPFIEAHQGEEILARAGIDFIYGKLARLPFSVREHSTGTLMYPGGLNRKDGLSLIWGADATYVYDSEILPEAKGLLREDVRFRYRAGLHYHYRGFDIFYGLTHLSREFKQQKEPQTVGSLSVRFSF